MFILSVFLGCGIKSDNDIYNVVKKGDRLSINLIKKAEQMIPYNGNLILTYNLSQRWNQFDYHLLFFDRDKTLYAACYFPSLGINRIEHDSIFGVLSESSNRRAKNYRNDIPKHYSILLKPRKVKGSRSVFNKVIYKIQLEPTGTGVKLYVKELSKNHNRQAGGQDEYFIIDTLEYSFEQLHFDYLSSSVSTSYIDASGKLIREKMSIVDPKILDRFYSEVISTCCDTVGTDYSK